MAGGAAGLAGLSGVEPGYLSSESKIQDIDQKQLDMAGNAALGRFLQAMSQPQGQQIQPQQAGGAPPRQPQPWSQGGMAPPGGPPLAGPPVPGGGGMQPMRQPAAASPPGMGGGAGPAAPGSTPNQPQQGQRGPASGGMSLPAVIQGIVKSNPGASPQVIAAAVKNFLPLMTADMQTQFREQSLAMREQALQMAEFYKSIAAEQGQQRIGQGQERIEQQGQLGQERVQQGQERVDVAKGESERKQTQGQERIDLAKQEEQRKQLKDKVTSDMQLKRLQAQLDAATQRKDQAAQRQALTAMHYRAMEIIESMITDKDTQSKILEENRKFYREQVDKLGSSFNERFKPDAGQ